MELKESQEFLHYHSPYLAVAWTKDYPMIGYLGVNSGGRGRNHCDTNLLRPGVGATLLCERQVSRDLPCSATHDEGSIRYEGLTYAEGRTQDCQVTFKDDRTFTVTVGGLVKDAFFRIAFAPDVCPPSLWARPTDEKEVQSKWFDGLYHVHTQSRWFDAPGLITLPDCGQMRVEADRPVRIKEELIPDETNEGLNLGLANASGHTARKAYHHGQVALNFCVDEPAESVELTFTVEPERFPRIEGCDFSDARWDGLKRCWMNSFTLNPTTLSLGDNYILTGLGHLAIHWKSDMSVFTPPLLDGLTLHDFFRCALETTFRERTDPDGRMHGYGWENGGCNLIALHDYLLGTNDWQLGRELMPIVRKVTEFNLNLDSDGDGILEAAYHGNHFHDEKTSLNWWDAFAFGHKDAYGNLVYYQAFRRMREVLEVLGETDLLQRVDAFLAKFKEAFHETFFNPDTGVYVGWISRDGRVHDYMFTFISAMAINEGLVEPDVARQVLQRLLDKLDENGYGEYKWGVPGPAIPVDYDDRSDWGPMADWGRYENGGFCGQTAYHFIQALYAAGMREQADRILFSMIDTFEHYPTHSGLNPGFCQSWDWRTRDGLPCGYNYLADNYVFLLAAITGHYGVEMPKLGRPE